MRSNNPFTPAFGIVPPMLAGRDALIDEMGEAFDNGLGDPNLSTLIIGPRGSGKTALLSCIADEARSRGWLAVETVADTGMLEDIIQRTVEASSDLIDTRSHPRISGLSIGQMVDIEWSRDSTEANWRTRMNALLDELAERDIGLLITVDEVKATVDEMIRMASAYQLFVREGRKVSLVMAGLPSNATDLIDNDSVSFLRRSRKRFLNRISDVDIEAAFRATIEGAGGSIEDVALSKAVEAIGGFPYMMQLVGYNVWRSSDEGRPIALEDLERGTRYAREEFRENMLESTYRDMSKGDIRFAVAMLPDEDGSSLSDVAQRMGVKTNYASTYKKRLMRQGIISERGGHLFDFDIPLLREYLRERA